MRESPIDPPGELEGEWPVLDEDEELLYRLENVKLAWGGGEETDEPPRDGGDGAEEGILAVTSARICWLGKTKSIEFDVPYIALHAVSRDPNTYPKPCLYCQLDEEEDLKEVFFIPQVEDKLADMFDAFSKAAELCPAPSDFMEDEGGEYDAEDNAGDTSILQHLESVLIEPHAEGQFDDASEDGNE
jgi:nucleotide-sensitive chloride channel 1A